MQLSCAKYDMLSRGLLEGLHARVGLAEKFQTFDKFGHIGRMDWLYSYTYDLGSLRHKY